MNKNELIKKLIESKVLYCECESCIYVKEPNDPDDECYCIKHREKGIDACVDGVLKYFLNK